MSEAKPGAQLQVDLRGLFPTSVAIVKLPDAERLNAELKQLILEREQAGPGTQHSNLGGWQSSWNLTEWGGPAAVDWRINCWANVNRQGHGNEFHTHPGAFWSGSYYIEDGGAAADPAAGGEFEVQDPRGLAPAMYAPMLTFAGPAGASLGASETIRPASGMMKLFLIWLQHAVRPCTGRAVRISIAFNLSLA